MARQHLESPTVFGSVHPRDGNVAPILATRGSAIHLGDATGECSIHLRSSDGRYTDTVIQVGSHNRQLRYTDILGLLSADPANVDLTTNLSASELREEDLLIGVWDTWAEQKRLENGLEPEVGFSGDPQRPVSWQPPRSSSKSTFFLQVARNRGPSVIAVCPPFASRVLIIKLASHREDEQPAAVPTFEGDGRLADAYGWFVATGAGEAADTVGSAILQSILESRTGKHDLDDLLAATQWCLRVGEDPKKIQELSRFLKPYEDSSDAQALQLLIDFHYESAAQGRLGKVLSTFNGNPPRLSATIGLMVDWLIPMRRVARHGPDWSAADEQAFEWMRRLADALVWDIPTTAYRALEPSDPDPEAVLTPDAGAKKKSSYRWLDHKRPSR